MRNERSRRTDLGMKEDPVRDALGGLERRLKEDEGTFEYRKTDDQVFRMLVEHAANKFALRIEEALEGSSEGKDGEPLGSDLLREEVPGGMGEAEAVESLLIGAGVGSSGGSVVEAKSVAESQEGVRDAVSEKPENPVVVSEPVAGAVEVAESQETAEAALLRYKAQYEDLRQEVQSRCTWEELSSRLNAKDGHYLKLAMDMQDKGKLVFIDEGGNPVFRDGGVEPVMKGMNYNDAREALYGKDYEEGTPHFGYEMPNSEKEMMAIEKFTKKPFVASDDGKERRSTWMESGKNPSFARNAVFNLDVGGVNVYGDVPSAEDPDRGVVRLLRVKKMA